MKKFRYGDLNLYMSSYKDDFNSAFQASLKPMGTGGVQCFSEIFSMKSNLKALNNLAIFLLYNMPSKHRMRYTMCRCAVNVGYS